MQTLNQSETGCLLLADITGYTSYLQSTELEHAQDVLADLMETLVNTLEPVFKLSKLEGDAAFAYAGDSDVSPTIILDTVEAGYFAFRRRLRDIDNATSCECNACVLIPQLDLKYFVHHGEFVVRRIASTEELTGTDVILAHRLMKGGAGAAIGTRAYAVYTANTFDMFGMNPEVLGFSKFTEDLPDVGEVDVFVADLGSRWDFERERNRVYVTESEADLSTSITLRAPREVVWDYITNGTKRGVWNADIDSLEQQSEGRPQTGTVNHCMHGPDLIIEHIADWRPFSYVTMDYPMSPTDSQQFHRHTNEFVDLGDGNTEYRFRLKAFGEEGEAMLAAMADDFTKQVQANGATLMELLEANLQGAE